MTALITSLCAHSPRDRPTAAAATGHPYFEELYRGYREEEFECCVQGSEACIGNLLPLSRGVLCSDARKPHFICGDCLTLHVQCGPVAELQEGRLRAGRVRCPQRPCGAGPYSDTELARHLHDGAFTQYITSRLELTEVPRSPLSLTSPPSSSPFNPLLMCRLLCRPSSSKRATRG